MSISKHPPILTTKQVAWKSCLRELLWFCRGDTDARHLQAQGVKIWDGNSSRAFLDARGLAHYPEGDIGPGYGFQWRHFGASYETCESVNSETGGVDQLNHVLHLLKTDPYSRRIFMSAWNPVDLKSMALPPCHVSAQFYVDANDNGLSCHVYQRSVDCFLGLPFNLLSYATLTYLLAKKAGNGLYPKELVISMGDVHIYKDHMDAVREQLSRSVIQEPHKLSSLIIQESAVEKSWESLTLEDDIILSNYHHYGPIKAPMSV